MNRGEAEGRTIAEMLRQALAELIPLDDPRRGEFLVRLAFADQAAHNSRLAAVQSQTLAVIRSRVSRAIANGTVCGEVAEGADATGQALRIVAFAEGLALHTHIDDAGTPESAVFAALDDQLGRVFTGTCRRGQSGIAPCLFSCEARPPDRSVRTVSRERPGRPGRLVKRRSDREG
ncbi:TetR family transcriptional regulator C-terminal domain-containing protein [Streptomyces thinghirensis]|nr:TetR family transcriptional regulator C-terminal domain-containing protein [Streptomyces thinghirensis]